MDLQTELLHWVAVWVVGFGALAIVIVITHRSNEPKQKLNRKFTLGLLLIISGTIVYLNSSSLLFVIDDYVDQCKEIEASANAVFNCVNEKQRIAKWEAFLMGFFASIAILIGTIMVAVNSPRHAT